MVNRETATSPSAVPSAPSGVPQAWVRIAASVREAQVPVLAEFVRSQGWTVQRTEFNESTGDIELAAMAPWGLEQARLALDEVAARVDAASTAGGVLELTTAQLDDHGMPLAHVRFTGPDAQSLEFAQLRYGLAQAYQHLEAVLGQAAATYVSAQATRIANDLHMARLSVQPAQTPSSLQVRRQRA